MSENSRTVASLGMAVIEELDASYTLVHIEQGMELSKDVVAALVKGENEWETKGGERLTEWESEHADTAAWQAVDDLAKEIVHRWEREDGDDYTGLLAEWDISTERDTAITVVRDRDQSTGLDDLIKAHGKVLLRVGIPAMNEDASLGFKPMSREEFLDLLKFEHTEENLTRAAEVVDNASPEFSVAMGYALLGVELAEFLTLPADNDLQVELRNPHVWLGSPFSGSGWCSEKPFTGTLTVRRGDLRTDEDAFGCSWGSVVGGASASYFSGSLAPVTSDK